MEASEIRLSNLVNIGMKDVNGQVISISKNEIHIKIDEFHYVKVKPSEVNPIPLTEEWLVKFGGERGGKKGDDWNDKFFKFKFNNLDLFSCPISGVITLSRKDEDVRLDRYIEHVHTFQNLIYFLTGQELTIK